MQSFLFKREFEGRFRLWHWFTVLVVVGLLATGLLRQTYLNSGKNGKIISAKLTELNISVDEKNAKDIAKTIRDPMWQWHNYFGFGLLGMLAFGAYARRTSDGTSPISLAKNALAKARESGDKAQVASLKEFAMIKIAHAAFIVFLGVMTVSGFAMYFKESLGLSKDAIQPIKEIHEFGLWVVLIFVVAHIAGVVRKELAGEHGLVSSIIGGK